MRKTSKERWKQIEKCPTHEVSNLGRVRKTATGLMVRIVTDKKYDFKQVTLPTDDGYKHLRVHREVAIAFVPNPKNLPLIGFRDGDKSNCRASNLKWMSYAGEKAHRDMSANEIRIDKGVKMPDRRGGSYPDPGEKQPHRILPYPIMTVGDSFCVGEYSASEMVRTANTNRNASRRGYGKFATRKMPDNTIRVWKVSK